MKTQTINVYAFDELDDKAKEKARQWWRESADFSHESEYVYEDAKDCLALVGFEIERIYYSGFWSQGDGACFVGRWRAKDVEPGKLKEHAPLDERLHYIAERLELLAAQLPGAYFKVEHRGHYYHEYCTEFTFSLDNEEGDEIGMPDDAELVLTEASRDAMRWIYRQLEKSYEWANADEQVDENIRANEYGFSVAGQRTAVLY